jgi:hypothetical protein
VSVFAYDFGLRRNPRSGGVLYCSTVTGDDGDGIFGFSRARESAKSLGGKTIVVMEAIDPF